MTTAAKLRAAIWWRTSTKAQTESSPETQIREAREMLEAQGYSVPDDYIIGADWHSLSILDCPQMETLLGWVRHGEIQAIGMYHGDRLAGNPGQKMFIVDLCDRYGVKLLARHSPIMEGKEGELLEYVRTWGKEQQVMRAQQASKDGLRDRVKVRGLPASARCPYGYSFATRRTDHGGVERDYTRMVPTEAWHVASLIWREALEGIPTRQIAKDLYRRGIRTPTGKDQWDQSTISNMLHNPVYAGRFYALRHRAAAPSTRRKGTYGNSSTVKRPIEDWVLLEGVTIGQPVVTWAQYEQIQERLRINRQNSTRNARNEYLLRKMIYCETHGRAYGAQRRKRANSNVYYCRGFYDQAVRVGPCARRNIGGTRLEAAVWSKAVELLTDPERVLNELELRRQSHSDAEAEAADVLAGIEKRLRKVNDMEMELVSMRLNDGVSEEIFERQLALIGAERTWCGDEQDRLARRLDDVRQSFATMEQIKVLQERVGGKLARATFKDKRFVLEALETRMTVAEDGAIRLSFSVPVSPEPVDDGVFVLTTPWA